VVVSSILHFAAFVVRHLCLIFPSLANTESQSSLIQLMARQSFSFNNELPARIFAQLRFVVANTSIASNRNTHQRGIKILKYKSRATKSTGYCQWHRAGRTRVECPLRFPRLNFTSV